MERLSDWSGNPLSAMRVNAYSATVWPLTGSLASDRLSLGKRMIEYPMRLSSCCENLQSSIELMLHMLPIIDLVFGGSHFCLVL